MTKEQIKKQDNIVIVVCLVLLLAIVMFLFMFNSKNTTASKENIVQKTEIIKVDGVTKANTYAISSLIIYNLKQDSILKIHDTLLNKFNIHFEKYHHK